MKMNRRGFAPIGIALIVAACIIVIGGAFYYFHYDSSSAMPPVQQPQPPVATTTASVSIYSITPASGPVGAEVTIDGFGFTQDNTIHFGSGVVLHVAASSGGPAIMCALGATNCHSGVHQHVTFMVPPTLDPACVFATPRCMIATQLTQPGTYAVSVSNTNGTSNDESFVVTASTTAGYSLYPSAGPIGATVTITGSGFAATGNVVTMNGLSAASLKDLPSADGKTITFIVPQTLGPVCNKSEMCAQFLVEVTPGTAYTVDVLAADSSASQTIGTFTITGDSGGHLPA